MNDLIGKFTIMPSWLKWFLLIMIALTVLKSFMRKERKNEVLLRYKFVTAAIAIFSCLTGAYYLNETLPAPASPQINQLFFFGQGNLQRFNYCCEFEVRNDGEMPCNLEKVEFVLDGTEFKNAKTGRVRITSGSGGGGARFSGRFGGGGGGVTLDVGSSYFPQSLSIMNQGFCVMGEAVNPNGEVSASIEKTDKQITIKFYFQTGNKTIVEERIVPILYGTISGVRL